MFGDYTLLLIPTVHSMIAVKINPDGSFEPAYINTPERTLHTVVGGICAAFPPSQHGICGQVNYAAGVYCMSLNLPEDRASCLVPLSAAMALAAFWNCDLVRFRFSPHTKRTIHPHPLTNAAVIAGDAVRTLENLTGWRVDQGAALARPSFYQSADAVQRKVIARIIENGGVVFKGAFGGRAGLLT